jgi:hypothetical protein
VQSAIIHIVVETDQNMLLEHIIYIHVAARVNKRAALGLQKWRAAVPNNSRNNLHANFKNNLHYQDLNLPNTTLTHQNNTRAPFTDTTAKV